MNNKGIIELINNIDIFADEVVEEELTPDECCLKLKEIIRNHSNGESQKQVLKCIDDLISLCDVIMAEQSTPDVIQEYLFYIMEFYQKAP